MIHHVTYEAIHESAVEGVEVPRAPLMLGISSLLLFLLSAFSGLVVAYAPAIALDKFLALLTGIVLALCLAFVGRFYQRWIMPMTVGVVLVTLASNLLLVWLQPNQLTSLVEQLVEPLVILLPLCVGWFASFQRRGSNFSSVSVESIGAVVLFLIAFFLIGTGDTSSGLGLMAGTTFAAWLLVQQRILPRRKKSVALTNRFLLVTATVILALYAWFILSPTAGEILNRWLPSFVPARVLRYHDFLSVIADYAFTGSGLGVSEMVYSSYLFLVQVPFQAQAHNLFLQLAVEQGIPGLIGYVALLIATLWALQRTLLLNASLRKQGNSHYLLAAATVGAIVTLIVDGMLDADNYSSQLVFLTFVPIGTAWGLFFASYTRPVAHYMVRYEIGERRSSAHLSAWSVAIAFIPFLLVGAMFLTPRGLAAAYANAGSVAQTKAELAIYDWQKWSIQDNVRLMNPERLLSAKRYFDIAISHNPYNVTAQWRLGQIALAQGDYFIAEQHLAQAYALAPQHRAVRQLLGEIYAIQGKSEQAIQLWAPLDLGQNQLELRLWWYQMIGDSNRAQNFLETVRLYAQSACCQ